MRSNRDRNTRKLCSEGSAEPSPGIDPAVKKKRHPHPFRPASVPSPIPSIDYVDKTKRLLGGQVCHLPPVAKNYDAYREFKSLIQSSINFPTYP
jgi:hypothetical protein